MLDPQKGLVVPLNCLMVPLNDLMVPLKYLEGTTFLSMPPPGAKAGRTHRATIRVKAPGRA
jgi:hypothetical protein